MRTIRNEMILASAGSGKTHELTTRFIALLAAGVAPERIAALTFTRKAAGEFFDAILTRLANAASSPGEAVQLAAACGRPGLGCGEFGALLRTVIGAMPRLTLGTMDSFFARVVGAFSLEMGLAGEIGILDEAQAAEAVRGVMGRFFGVTHRRRAGQEAIIEAFKLATMGVEAKNVTRLIDSFLADYHELYREAGDPQAWGNVRRIWPDGFPWDDTAGPEERLRTLRDWLEGSGDSMTEGQRGRWEAFADAFQKWAPGGPWPAALEYVVSNVLKAGSGFASGDAPVRIDRRMQCPPPAVRAAVAGLVRRVVALEIGRRITVTQGIGSLLEAFDAAYDAEVRRSGRLTFSDVVDLLGASGILGSAENEVFARREVEFRLDGRIDHWLLDEFQDTSRRQWQVLEGLIDEAVQDPSGTRSLFYVGDVKQAIFSWRGGDPRLFEHVRERYSGGESKVIDTRELNRSWRSGEAILSMVNSVFGCREAVAAVFPEASDRWTRTWRTHETAVPERKGQAAVLLADDEDGRLRTTLELIRTIDPPERGFSCAVLVRTNDVAARFAEFLRREGGIRAVAESDLRIGGDNPWSATFVSLLKAAAHPGDTVSWRHLMMTPARDWLAEAGVATPDALVRRMLALLGENGYEHLAAVWMAGMRQHLAGDDHFTLRRAEQLLAAARAFDEGGGGPVAAFIRFVEAATAREAEGEDVVRVMTVHKSKGLGFDVVILPDLEGGGLAARRKGPAVAKRDDGTVKWILDHPGGLVAGHDAELGACLQAAKSDAAFDSLALLYVAMTRAKRGLFAVMTAPGKSSACSYPRFLAESLGSDAAEVTIGDRSFPAVHSTGDKAWLHTGTRGDPVSEWKPEVVSETLAVNRFERKVASRTGRRIATIAEILGEERRAGAAEGIALHALFSEIEWLDGSDPALWRASAIQRGVAGPVIDAAAAVLRSDAGRAVFERPGEGWEAWREQAFEALVGDVWVSGVVDRVCIRRDEEGRIRDVRIFEFKSGRRPADAADGWEADRFGEQIGLYRQMLAMATGVAAGELQAGLVFTRECRLIWM